MTPAYTFDELVLSTTTSTTPSSVLPPFHCHRGALTNYFGLLVQTILGVAAFASLLIKRNCEPFFQRRPWLIWVFDTSKQAIGTFAVHIINIVIARLPSGHNADPCFWYMFNYLLDSTLGLVMMYVGIRLIALLGRRFGWLHLRLGDYGKIQRLRAWLCQCLLYVALMVFEKLIMFLVMFFVIMEYFPFEWLANLSIDPRVEVSLAMFVVPFIVNVIWFWLIDNMLMRQRRSNEELRGSANFASTAPLESSSTSSVGGPPAYIGSVRYGVADIRQRLLSGDGEAEHLLPAGGRHSATIETTSAQRAAEGESEARQSELPI